MGETKIKDESQLEKAVKRSLAQLQQAKKSLNDTKKYVDTLRDAFDETPPAGVPDVQKGQYKDIVKGGRTLLDRDIQKALKELEDLIADSQRALARL